MSANYAAPSYEEASKNFVSSSTKRRRTRHRNVFGENLLTIVTIVGVLGGTVFGILLKKSKPNWTQRELMYIQYPGDLFLRMLKCLIVPLIVASITSAIGALDLTLSKRIALR